jgi:hypothetical protein
LQRFVGQLEKTLSLGASGIFAITAHGVHQDANPSEVAPNPAHRNDVR